MPHVTYATVMCTPGRAAPGNLKRDGFLLPNLWIAALLEAKMQPTRPVHSVPCIDIKIRRLPASVRTRVWVMAGDRVTVRTENEAQTKDAGFTKRKGGGSAMRLETSARCSQELTSCARFNSKFVPGCASALQCIGQSHHPKFQYMRVPRSSQ